MQTARSAIRATYDEFINIKSTVIDGAQLGFWSDSSRSLAGSNFGGWGASFDSVTFYDIADSMVRHDGTRGKSAVSFRSCAFNPINISPVRAFDVDNIEGLLIQTSQFTPSTTRQPTEQWLRILGCTGVLDSNTFSGPTSKVGTIGGVNPTAIRWSNNRVACLSGLTITGGVITGSGNEYSIADHGVDVVPVAITTLDIGPDIFKAGVSGNSYRISADSSLLGGRINYIFEQDNSNSKFSNVSSRVSIDNVDRRISTIGSLPSTASPYFSGRTYNVTVAGTFTLPTPIPGIRLRVMKSTATALTVSTTSGSNILVGASSARTSAVATAAEIGPAIEFVAFSSTSWVAQVLSGSWSFT
ncbi:putative NinX [Pseudomonas phage MPK9]